MYLRQAIGATGCAAVSLAAAALLLPGCSSGEKSAPDVVLQPSDFVSEQAAAAEASDAPQPAPEAMKPAISREQAREGISDVVVVQGAPKVAGMSNPADATLGPPPPGGFPVVSNASGESVNPPPPAPVLPPSERPIRSLTVDEVVGQINGRPIFAAEFFKDKDARLRQESEKLNGREWMAFLTKETRDALRDLTRDEILLSEFHTSLKLEQKQGIAAFIQSIKEDIISSTGGSAAYANDRSIATEGMTLDERVKSISDREFIRDQLRRAVSNRVQVSSRDIHRYYEQHIEEFQPPAEATFRILQIPARDTARIEKAEAALAAGDQFDAIAAKYSSWNTAKGNVQKIEFRGPSAEAAFFGPAALNNAARQLSAGQVSPRLRSGDSVWWLKLEALKIEPAQSFYDVQLEIEIKLRTERFNEEETRYFSNLLKRTSSSDFNEMVSRLVEFANARYKGSGRVSQPAAKPAPRPPSGSDQPGAEPHGKSSEAPSQGGASPGG